MHAFIVDVLCLLHPTWNFDKAKTLLVESEVRTAPVLSFLFHDIDQQRDVSPRNLRFLFIYISNIVWPSLGEIENADYRDLPEHWPISGITRLLSRPPTSRPALAAVVARILVAIRPNANLDPTLADFDELQCMDPDVRSLFPSKQYFTRSCRSRHPASPYLWLAAYLAHESDVAARLLLTGGVVHHLTELYDAEFPDPRATGHITGDLPCALQGGQSQYDLHRLSFTLLSVLSKRTRATKLAKDDGTARALQELKADIREDIRCRSRMISETYHFYCDWDELQAEHRDRIFLESLEKV